MPSYPGPYQVEITYSGNGRDHKMRLDLQLQESPVAGTDLNTLNALMRSGGTVGLTSAVGSFVNLLQPFFSVNTTFDDFSLWKFTAGTYERLFIGTAAIGLAGTNPSGIHNAHYKIFTWRNQLGGTTRVTLLDDAGSSDLKISYGSSGANSLAVFDFVAGSTNWIYGRDNSYPIAPLNDSNGQNERLWRKVYRQ